MSTKDHFGQTIPLTHYMDLKTAKLSRLKLFKFDPRLILEEFENVTLLTLNCLNMPLQTVFTAHLFYVLYGSKLTKLSRFKLKTKLILWKLINTKLFCFYYKSVTGVFMHVQFFPPEISRSPAANISSRWLWLVNYSAHCQFPGIV